ncbi:excinuclease ABC subunit UvrA, partial [Candidatus Uhrbacteria bacterium]|nr:excinuclease ABC subunit UvrA [Candidatus Uhrbacteria bacterium]
EIHYKDKTISDVLEMTVEEAASFFADQPLIHEKLSVLKDVGLGYLKLGQSATTLSGGEAQRVKLSTELSRRATGKTLYILDEPTTGLHFDDIKRLLTVLQALVDKGNTVLVIEHNLDVVKSADWVIDMGPEGGVKGGEIVAEGTPEEIAKSKKSLTAAYLKKVV